MFKPFVNISLTKIFFSVYIIYSSVNFLWFALLSHQKFDNRSLSKPGDLWFAAISNSLKINVSMTLKYCCYKPISNKSEIIYIYRKILKKNYIVLKKITHIHWMNVIYIYLYIINKTSKEDELVMILFDSYKSPGGHNIWIFKFHTEQIHIFGKLNKPSCGHYKFISAGLSIRETNLFR